MCNALRQRPPRSLSLRRAARRRGTPSAPSKMNGRFLASNLAIRPTAIAANQPFTPSTQRQETAHAAFRRDKLTTLPAPASPSPPPSSPSPSPLQRRHPAPMPPPTAAWRSSRDCRTGAGQSDRLVGGFWRPQEANSGGHLHPHHLHQRLKSIDRRAPARRLDDGFQQAGLQQHAGKARRRL